MATIVLETCRIPPRPGGAAELSLPLTFFDMKWLHFTPIRRILFYDHPNCSEPYFLETLVPKLKEALSLTLKHYLPVAGNLILPVNEKPSIRYVAGDSVSLKIAVSGRDLDELVGNHARDADQFYDFMPEMPSVTEEHECKIAPVLALQVSLFPGCGICIGFANLHCLGDASSIVGFVQAWASICKLDGDEGKFLTKQGDCSSLPIYDRSVIRDPLGIDDIFWKVLKHAPLESHPFPLPTNRVRATYTLHQPDIKRLKDFILTKKPGLGQVSSFVATTSYVWSCVVKSEERVDCTKNIFIFSVDVRSRIEPPVPANYFGNCLGHGLARIEQERLIGEDGFVIAAEAIAEDIRNRVNNKDEVLRGTENWMTDVKEFESCGVVGVSGSPRFDLAGADFGWGRARKLEVVSIDGEGCSVSMCKSNDSQGGLEFGLSLPKQRMEAFAAAFGDGLKLINQQRPQLINQLIQK